MRSRPVEYAASSFASFASLKCQSSSCQLTTVPRRRLARRDRCSRRPWGTYFPTASVPSNSNCRVDRLHNMTVRSCGVSISHLDLYECCKIGQMRLVIGNRSCFLDLNCVVCVPTASLEPFHVSTNQKCIVQYLCLESSSTCHTGQQPSPSDQRIRGC